MSDFGLSKVLDNSKSHVSGMRKGTPLYIPPEVLNEGKGRKAADLFPFGVMMWELYHGRTVWHQYVTDAKHGSPERAAQDYRAMILHRTEYAEGAQPASFVRLALSCISDAPSERPTFAEVLEALEGIRREVIEGFIITHQAAAIPRPAEGPML